MFNKKIMLKNISWSGYLTFMLITLVVYYVIICLKYYRDDIRSILSGTHKIFSKRNFKGQSQTESNQTGAMHNERLNGDDFLLAVNQLTEEIKYSLKEAAANNLIKQEVIYSLQQLAKKYFQIKGTPFQSFIANYVLVESANYSSIHLSEEDLNAMWVM